MILYGYRCAGCNVSFDYFVERIDMRDFPCTQPCPNCGEYEVQRLLSITSFYVPEGSVGNAKNGYSSTHGDSENFKARDRGEAPPYGSDCKVSDK